MYIIYIFILHICVYKYINVRFVCVYICILYINPILKKAELRISFNFLLKVTNMNGWIYLIFCYFYHLGSETGSSAQYFILNHLLCGIKAFLNFTPASYIFWFNVTEFSKNFSFFLLKLPSKISRKALVSSGIVMHKDELSLFYGWTTSLLGAPRGGHI